MKGIPVLGIDEIVFEVEYLDRAIAFCRDVIGLTLESRGPQSARLRVGDQSLALFTPDRDGSGLTLRVSHRARRRESSARWLHKMADGESPSTGSSEEKGTPFDEFESRCSVSGQLLTTCTQSDRARRASVRRSSESGANSTFARRSVIASGSISPRN